MTNKIKLFVFVIVFFPLLVFAQEEQDGAGGFEFGVHFGRLLPNQVDYVTEILPLWGTRWGFAVGEGTVEVGNVSGAGNGAQWNNLYTSLRTDMQVQDLMGVFYIGLDGTQYVGSDGNTVLLGGGHIGGGIVSKLSRNAKLRVDMKFNINPATSLYISIGLMLGNSVEPIRAD